MDTQTWSQIFCLHLGGKIGKSLSSCLHSSFSLQLADLAYSKKQAIFKTQGKQSQEEQGEQTVKEEQILSIKLKIIFPQRTRNLQNEFRQNTWRWGKAYNCFINRVLQSTMRNIYQHLTPNKHKHLTYWARPLVSLGQCDLLRLPVTLRSQGKACHTTSF